MKPKNSTLFTNGRYWFVLATLFCISSCTGEAGWNDAATMFAKGKTARASKDYSSARRYYSRAAALGNTGAMTQLAYMNATGQGAAVDSAQARALFQQAAANGNATAMNNWASSYSTHAAGC